MSPHRRHATTRASPPPQPTSPLRNRLGRSSTTRIDRLRLQPHPSPAKPSTQDSSFQRLATLNLQLSRTVLKPMGEWDLAPLLAQAEQLSGEVSDASLRAQAIALKRRITEFDSLQQRHLELSQPDGAKTAAAAQFAGQGWLVPVVTSCADLPHYALTDEKGQIQHFVSSQPGLNLRRYVRKRVGVVGVPGDASTTKRSHVIASRVVLLDRH